MPDEAHATYFANHRLGRRFPWSLYHRPIDAALSAFLAPLPRDAVVLNVGCGIFANLDDLPPHVRYVGTDIDPAAVEAARSAHPTLRVERAQPLSLPFADREFDALFATEVIEHCLLPERWLREVMRVLKPGSRALLTTPNYGSMSLKAIESTALELIARAQGFTRDGIHPLPFTAPALEALIRAVGGVEARTRTVARGWVIVAEFKAP